MLIEPQPKTVMKINHKEKNQVFFGIPGLAKPPLSLPVGFQDLYVTVVNTGIPCYGR